MTPALQPRPIAEPEAGLDDTPEARTDSLLAEIAAADGLWHASEGRNLAGLLAAPHHLEGKRGTPEPHWWNEESGGLNLVGASLRSANLVHATLPNANCRGIDLTGAVARSADLSNAIIEEGRFGSSDFGGSIFKGAKAGEANFEGAMLEDAVFDDANLRYARFGDALIDGGSFARCDLWGAVLDKTDADEACFRQARLDEASLVGGNFSAADFTEASLKKGRADGANFQSANFEGARLDGTSLANADLSRASLPRVNLLSCDLSGARFAGAWLESTRIRVEQLGGSVGEERAGDLDGARQAYLALEQNFRSLGDAEGESWAFRKRRGMGKRHAWEVAAKALGQRHYRVAAAAFGRGASDSFVEWLCDYGESLWRTVRAFFVTMLGFAALYGVTGTLTRAVQTASGPAREVTRNPLDLLVFSFMNMLSTSAPDIGIKPSNELVVLLSSAQGALGIVLIGLFGYVLGNRMHR